MSMTLVRWDEASLAAWRTPTRALVSAVWTVLVVGGEVLLSVVAPLGSSRTLNWAVAGAVVVLGLALFYLGASLAARHDRPEHAYR